MAEDKTAEGRAKHRRVEISILSEQRLEAERREEQSSSSFFSESAGRD